MKDREIRMQFEKYLETIGMTHKKFQDTDSRTEVKTVLL